MSKISEAQQILAALGMPKAQQNEMAALTLLALCGVKPEDSWSLATRRSLTVTKGIMSFIATEYGRTYAPNTRETVRRQVIHQFEQGRIIDKNPDNPLIPDNSKNTHYALSEAALAVIKTYGTPIWDEAVATFKANYGSLKISYEKKRQSFGIPVTLPDGSTLMLSPGKHNQLQSRVIEQFAPQFASGSVLLYLGDTANKNLFMQTEQLNDLGISVTEHGKLPDIMLYLASQNWLYLIEVFTSHGPMTPKRLFELNEMLHNCTAGAIFVTAFQSFDEFRKQMRNIAWETEVWVAEEPEHLIHFNGDRFLGPRT
jgi:type II restriction enzyme